MIFQGVLSIHNIEVSAIKNHYMSIANPLDIDGNSTDEIPENGESGEENSEKNDLKSRKLFELNSTFHFPFWIYKVSHILH